jgi:hypothetical protein
MGKKCWWLDPVDEGIPGQRGASFSPAKVVDFPCENIVDRRGLTLEPTVTPFSFAGAGLCYVGGHVMIEAAAGAPPPHTVGLWAEADPFMAQDMLVSGTATGIRAGKGSTFFVRDTRFHNITENCIDNGERRPGHVKDAFFDGCFRLYDSSGTATEPPAEGDHVVIEQSLIRLSGEAGRAGPFRFGDRLPQISLLGNVILVEGSPISGTPGLPDASLLAACKDNVVVNTGTSDLSGHWPAECVRVTGDRSVWDKAVAAWEAAH